MSFKTIFAAIFGIIALSFLIGMCKTCKAKQKEKEVTTEQPAEETGKPGSSKAKAAAPLIPEQTFQVICADADGTVTAISPCSTTNGRWKGTVCDYGNVIPDPGMVIVVTLPGYYLNNKDWHSERNVILRGGQSNPPLSPRGKGELIIRAGQ